MNRRTVTVCAVTLAVTATLAASGCASGGGVPTPAATTGSQTSTATSGSTSSASTTTPAGNETDETTGLLLAEQITSLGGANGEGTDCAFDARAFVEPGEPGIWLAQNSVPEINMPYIVFLCLAGFPIGTVAVDVTVGDETFHTDVVLFDSSTRTDTSSPTTDTLFENGELLAGGSDGIYQSNGWYFIPPSDIRDALVVEGEVTLVATAGHLRARRTQPVNVADKPYRFWLEFGEPFLVVYGFPAGTRVPVGLYRVDAATPNEEGFPRTEYTLVDQIGVVTMPVSRVAVFEVPRTVLAAVKGDVEHCVTVPLDSQNNCPTLPR